MTQRIHSIDALRGLCLLNIFASHVTLGKVQELSPSKLFLFDAADVFVLLAGVSTFIAYGRTDLGNGRQRMYRRALTLYLANIAIVAASFAILAAGGLGLPGTSSSPHALVAAHGPLRYAWHAMPLQQSVGYSMVLRLYVVLMLVAPAYVWLARRRFWYPLLPAGLIWLASGHFGIASHDSLTGELLSMTLLPWQLVFAAGVSLGAAVVQQVPLPRSRAADTAALVLAVAGTALLLVGPYVSPAVHTWLEVRNDHFWTGISKSYQSPLRLLHLLALTYLFMAFVRAPVIRLVHQARKENLLCRLGRNSLPVFAFGAVFALGVDQLLWRSAAAQLFTLGSAGAGAAEVALALLGLALMNRIAGRKRRESSARPGFAALPVSAA